MDLTKLVTQKENMKDPQELEFIFGGPDVSFFSTGSNTNYRVGANRKFIFVDSRDVDFLLSLNKKGRFYFVTVSAETVDDENNTIVENGEDDFSDVIDYRDDFTVIKGIGKSLADILHNDGVYMFEDLLEKGAEYINALPRMNEDRAKDIQKQLKELIIKESYDG